MTSRFLESNVSQVGKEPEQGAVYSSFYALPGHESVRDSRCKSTDRWARVDPTQLRIEDGDLLCRYYDVNGLSYETPSPLPYCFGGTNGALRELAATRMMPMGIASATNRGELVYDPRTTRPSAKLSMAVRTMARAQLCGSFTQDPITVHPGQALMMYVPTLEDTRTERVVYTHETTRHGLTARDKPFLVPICAFNSQVFDRDAASLRAMKRVHDTIKSLGERAQSDVRQRAGVALLAEDGRDVMSEAIDKETIKLAKEALVERGLLPNLQRLLEHNPPIRHVEDFGTVVAQYQAQLFCYLQDAQRTGDYYNAQVDIMFLHEIMLLAALDAESGVRNTRTIMRADVVHQLQSGMLDMIGVLAQVDISQKSNCTVGYATTGGNYQDHVSYFFQPAQRITAA